MKIRSRGFPTIPVLAALVAILVTAIIVPTVAAFVITETKLTASDAEAGDRFSRVNNSLAMSEDVAVIGAYTSDDAGDSSGSAYIFRRSGGTWTEEAKLTASDAAPLDLFGVSVAISGEAVVIGSSFDDDDGSHSGSAYVFRGSGGIWSEEAKLTASDAAEADQFGGSVSLDGNVAVIGAPFDDDAGSDSGSAYVFRWDGTSWSQEAKLVASDGAAGDAFGHSISISGNAIIVAAVAANAPRNNSGAAYIFRHDGTSWSQEAKLVASDGDVNDRFGFSASIDGNTAVAGADHAGQGGGTKNAKGAAYVFLWDGTSWSEEAKLTASDGAKEDEYGDSVGISGELVVVGARMADAGATDTGAAYVYQRSGTVWTEENKLTASDAALGDFFGETVSINGTTVLVGAPRDDDAGSASGAVYVYDLN